MQKLSLKHKLIILLSGLLIELVLGTVYAYSVLRVYLENQLSLNQVQSSIPYLTSLAVFAVLVMLSGRWIKPKSFIIWLFSGIALVTAGFLFASISHDYIMFALSYGVLIGAGVGILYGIPVRVVQSLFKERQGLAVGLTIGGFGLSPVITAPLLQISLDNIGLHDTLMYFGISSGIILLLLSFVLLYKTNVKNLYIVRNEKYPLITGKVFWLFFVIFIVGIMFGLSMIGLTSFIAIHDFALTTQTASLWIILFSLSNGLARPLFGYIYDRYKLKTSVIILCVMTLLVCGYYLFIGIREEFMFVISMTISWATVGGWLSLMPAITKDLFGVNNFAKNYGMMYLSYGLAAIIGNLYTSYMIDQHVDLGFVFIPLMVFIFIIMLIITFGTFGKRRAPKS